MMLVGSCWCLFFASLKNVKSLGLIIHLGTDKKQPLNTSTSCDCKTGSRSNLEYDRLRMIDILSFFLFEISTRGFNNSQSSIQSHTSRWRFPGENVPRLNRWHPQGPPEMGRWRRPKLSFHWRGQVWGPRNQSKSMIIYDYLFQFISGTLFEG